MNLSPLAFILFAAIFAACVTFCAVAIIGACSDSSFDPDDNDHDN